MYVDEDADAVSEPSTWLLAAACGIMAAGVTTMQNALTHRLATEFKRRRLQYRRDTIPGGLGDTAKASQFDREQVAKGIRVEMEHTDDPRVALDIVLDHLSENPTYYDELAKLKLSRMLSMEFDRVRYAKFVESEHPRDADGKFTESPVNDVSSNHIGYHHGQHDFRTEAHDQSGKVIGYLEYTLYNGELYVNHVKVSPEFRRRGVATRLYDHMLSEHPDADLLTASQTPEGAAFRSAFNSTHQSRLKNVDNTEDRPKGFTDSEWDYIKEQWSEASGQRKDKLMDLMNKMNDYDSDASSWSPGDALPNKPLLTGIE